MVATIGASDDPDSLSRGRSSLLLTGRKSDDAAPAANPKTTVFAFVVYFAAIAAVFGLAAVWLGEAMANVGPPAI